MATNGTAIAQDLADSFRRPIKKVQDAMTAPGDFLMHLLGISPESMVQQPAAPQGQTAFPPVWRKSEDMVDDSAPAPKPVLRMKKVQK